ncbi:Narbonolide/10-deoxymethynolide synthase PikA1, modules 1 and 2 [BD1-7 clade bacterium]|uniref:Narbonolide/10-deoxymethynolide synthase PikA1, modules 1 and 2 n=1 Tax=BD1-7 clade bacterium TaxID=2029982 RepID=A0A5S9MQB6_9GAMM|nr:Narbonolide/10-deoxymethynolide synthase PikA1, modules 1 and 2 [BD1-7 clade bacterium]
MSDEISFQKKLLKLISTQDKRIRELESVASDSIAIVGMACRLPGGISTPEAFWRALELGDDLITKVPAERWDVDAFYDPDREKPGTLYCRNAAFISDVDQFDAGFFRISKPEAEYLDPQQRIMLELSWEAIERAGIVPDTLNGSPAGVYMGCGGSQYQNMDEFCLSDHGFGVTGNALSTLSGRISYCLGLRGPSMTLDTACSSSLVSLHQACLSLRSKETNLALCGGVSLILRPSFLIQLCRLGVTSPDGRVKAFSDEADGTGWGEGAAVLVLKRLADAERDGDPIQAVIKGSAVNQDGKSSGLTAPNAAAQSEVIASALANAGVDAQSIDYVETHGTGTELGDPIEAGALGSVFRSRSRPLYIGSVKSNIGHTMQAAGVAGLIKSVLALQHRQLPASLYSSVPSRHIDWDMEHLQLVSEKQPWPTTDSPERAGVSSFGISGTNAHVILERYNPEEKNEQTDECDSAVLPRAFDLIPVSAKSEKGLIAQQAQLTEFVASSDSATTDIGGAMAMFRSQYEHRSVCFYRHDDKDRQKPYRIVSKKVADPVAGAVAFMFTGQGAQLAGMGKVLYQVEPVFTASLDACAEAFANELDVPLLDLMFADADSDRALLIHQTAYTQPLLFSLGYALAQQWQAWGAKPQVLIGHSIGEITAACIGGGISLHDACRLVAARGRLMQQLPEGGAMLSVNADSETVSALIKGEDRLAIAAINGPAQTVVSGDEALIESLQTRIQEQGIKTKQLSVSHAFHSPLMSPMLTSFEQIAQSIHFLPLAIPLISNVGGRLFNAGEHLTADHWVTHVSATVDFRAGMDALQSQGIGCLIEMGPQAVLLGMASECLSQPLLALASMQKDKNEGYQLLRSLAEWFVCGGEVDWHGVYSHRQPRRVDVPTYAFQRKRYWMMPDLPTSIADPHVVPDMRLQWIEQASVLADEDVGVVTHLDSKELTERKISDWQIGAGAKDVLVIYWVDDVDLGHAADLVHDAVLCLQWLLKQPYQGNVLWVTRGAQLVGTETSQGANANRALWGLVRSLEVERDSIALQIVDDDGTDTMQASMMQALQSNKTERCFAVRDQRLYVQRLMLLQQNQKKPKREWDTAGTYLITGGLGGLGQHVACWLAREKGIRHIVVLSRRGSDTPQASVLREELLRYGARLEVLSCDCSDYQQLRGAINNIHASSHLKGVLHAAGQLEFALIEGVSRETIDQTFAAKVDGAWYLHGIMNELDIALDDFILYSSASVFMGGVPGNSVYAAANSCLDALAEYRVQSGLPAVAMAWGTWNLNGAGMAGAMDEAGFQGMEERGVIPINDALGNQLYSSCFRHGDACIAAQPFNIEKLRDFWGVGLPHLFDQLVLDSQHDANVSDTTTQAHRWLEGWSTLSESQQFAVVNDKVNGCLMDILDLDDPVKPRRPLSEYGLDSLTAVKIRNQLMSETGLTLPANILFDYPTAESLTNLICARLMGEPLAEGQCETLPELIGTSENIAVISMSCRFPDHVMTPEALWDVFERGGDVIRHVPENHWPGAAPFDGLDQGGFIDDIDMFEPEFFGISDREAKSLDPQQRFLLELSWESLERAGICPEQLQGSDTGVFIGIAGVDYVVLTSDQTDDVYRLTGTMPNTAAGRISYTFGLQGPCMTIDTACSSSLVSLHQACRALQLGECSLALTGGVTLQTTASTLEAMGQMDVSASDGRCKAFSDQADGAGWSDGASMLVLKRLSDAERDGDDILGVICASGVNQDGRSAGLTVPNGPAQQRLLRRVLSEANLAPDDIDYVEAHGTGTKLGDPIEAGALAAVHANRTSPLLIGTAKSNLGHSMAASGVAGVMKVLLSLQNQILPKTLHAEAPSAEIDWQASPLKLVQQNAPWPKGARVRRAGVSSFGISGTNAHVVIQEPPVIDRIRGESLPRRASEILCVSARSEDAADVYVTDIEHYLENYKNLAAQDIAYALACSRTHFDHRRVLLLSDGGMRHIVPDSALNAKPMGFMFTGQGSQLAGMGRALYRVESIFTEALDACEEAFAGELDVSLQTLMFAEHSSDLAQKIHETCYTQPLLFALGYALAKQWQAWGAEPQVVLGHSVGEITAVCVAGGMPLDDACRLIAARGRLMQALPKQGAMMSVKSDADHVAKYIDGYPGIAVAAINGPLQTVISGESAGIDELERVFRRDGLDCKRLTVSHAFHSPLMMPMLDAFQEVAESVDYHPVQVPVVSNIQGREFAVGERVTASHWVDHVMATVDFNASLSVIAERNIRCLIEMGAQPFLSGMVEECLDSPILTLASLRKDRNDNVQLASSLARWYVHGGDVDWETYYQHRQGLRVNLPTYPFQRKSFWAGDAGDTSSGASVGLLYAVEWKPMHMAVENETCGNIHHVPLNSQALAHLQDLLPHVATGDVLCVDISVPESFEQALAYHHRALAVLQALLQCQDVVIGHLPVIWHSHHALNPSTDADVSASVMRGVIGMLRAARQEYPDTVMPLIDTDLTEHTSNTVDSLIDVLLSEQSEQEWLWRDRELMVPRLQPVKHQAAITSIRNDGCVVISGGLGALGLHLAQYLIEKQDIRALALFSRRGIEDPQATSAISLLEAMGARVDVYSVDVSDKMAVEEAFTDIARSGRIVRGIFHTAGVLADAMLLDQTDDDLTKVFAGKVQGAWNLHEVSRDLDLDCFVCYSSAAATFGGLGQSVYAAANMAMEGLMAHRRLLGMPAQAIAWGPWSSSDVGGMTATLSNVHQSRVEQKGLEPITSPIGREILTQCMNMPSRDFLAAPINWDHLSRQAGGLVPGLYADLMHTQGEHKVSSSWIERLSRESLPTQRRAMADRFVGDVVNKILECSVDLSAPLKDQGMDSLAAVTIRNQLARYTGIKFSPSLMYDYPTVMRLSKFVYGELENLPAIRDGIEERVADAAVTPFNEVSALDDIADYLAKVLDGNMDPDIRAKVMSLKTKVDAFAGEVTQQQSVTDNTSVSDTLPDDEIQRRLLARLERENKDRN